MESIGTPALWIGFVAFILAMLALDLGVFHRKAHEIRFREAATWTLIWVALAAVFAAGVFLVFGPQRGLDFTAGYLIEKALSVDNIFVFVMIFSYFGVPSAYQHRVLFWGILGALVMRAVFILAGGAFLHAFHWAIYVFGAFLVLTGVKMFAQKHGTQDPGRSPIVRLARRVLPVTDRYHGARLMIREGGKTYFTPLFLTLLAVEFTDVIFAIDSIPAIFAITDDPFIVFTSNMFAILGLRSLYFLLAGLVDRFVYLKPALAFILVFVGVKMMLVEVFKIPVGVSLGVICATLSIAVIASLRKTRGLASSMTAGHGPHPVPPARDGGEKRRAQA